MLVVGLVVLLIVIGAAYFIFLAPKAPVSTSTTTTSGISVSNVAACTTITKPGLYYITQDIYTQISNGTCITIDSSNVKLIGNRHIISGNGPFVQVAPYTYAIAVNHANNVSISLLNITKFSYGIYFNGSSYGSVNNATVRNSTLTGIYLYNTYNSSIINSKANQAQGPGGGIYLQGGGNNTVLNSTLQYNAQYGLRINSTGNKVVNDSLLGNPVDLYCNGIASFKSQNRFSNTACYVNDYCNFAYCKQSNNVSNITALALPYTINTCGNIESPGTYTLGSDLNMEEYVNSSYAPSRSLPCITISTQNVKLNCQGHTIRNAGYGIYEVTKYGLTVANCNFNNDTYAMFLANLLQVNVTNTTASNGTYSLYLYNSTYGNITNVRFLNNVYGAYFNISTLFRVSGYYAHGNRYGAFLDNSNTITFAGGNTTSNTKADLYCSVKEYNYTTNIFSKNMTCGVTDCNWAYPQCKSYIAPAIKYLPVRACGPIAATGNYSLTSNIIGIGDCLKITASNVLLNCRGYSVISQTTTGNAITVNGQSNVTITNCNVYEFTQGISVSNSRNVNITNVSISSPTYSLSMYNTTGSTVHRVNSTLYGVNGFLFNRVRNSVISNDIANSSAIGSIDGFQFIGSDNNTISFDNSTENKQYGYWFNDSIGNRVYNNSASRNIGYDYYCSPDSSGFVAEYNGINYGATKFDCAWLAVIVHGSLGLQCRLITTQDRITLTEDYVYPYGQTCFDLENGTTSSPTRTFIDCQGHTIIATDGGTFIDIINGTSVTLQNCNLKGFGDAIISGGDTVQILNNNITATGTAIYAANSASGARIDNNTVLSATNGIIVRNTSYSFINNNRLSNISLTGMGIESSSNFDNVLGDIIKSSGTGLNVSGSIQGTYGNDNVVGSLSAGGFACYGISVSTGSNNNDKGNNICSSNNNCQWMQSSPTCKV